MRIRRFNESEEVDLISFDKTNDIINDIKEMSAIFDSKRIFIEKLSQELDIYKSDSGEGNTQIDDSISSLQIIRNNITDSIDKLDNIVINLSEVNEKGTSFIYDKNNF